VRFSGLVLVPTALAVIAGGNAIVRAKDSETPARFAPVVGRPTRFGVSPPVSSLLPSGPRPPIREEKRENPPVRRIKRPFAPGFVDRALQAGPGGPPLMPSTIQNFEATGSISNFNVFGVFPVPPDTNGDVGPNHYVQTVNLLVQIFNKSGTSLGAPFPMSQLFAGTGGPCDLTDDGDPIVLYDHLADRWFLSQLALPTFPDPPFYQCIAVSRTGDPTGAYNLYEYTMPGVKLNDYPKFGVWPDAYYMTDNQFVNLAAGGTFAGGGAFAFDRAKMLAGDPTAAFIYFDLALLDPDIGGMLPSDLDGPPPPAGSPNHFVYLASAAFGSPTTGLRIYDFHADFATPASSTFTVRPESTLAVTAFDPDLCGFGLCIPQPSTIRLLDPLSDRLMARAQYRNFGTSESLVLNHSVDVGGDHAGVRYYEVRRTLPAGSFAVANQVSYAPDADHRWMGSAAMDHQGNLAVGYSVSSAATFPSIRYAGRLATDPPNVLAQGEATLQAGSGSQTSVTGRWGDYSGMVVDPVDDCTFWYTTEYYSNAPPGGCSTTRCWQTRVGSFQYPTCTPTPRGTLQGTVTSAATSLPIPGALVATSDGFSRLTAAAGTYSMSLPAGAYTVTASKPGYFPSTVPVVILGGSPTTQDFSLVAVATATVSGDATICPGRSATIQAVLTGTPPWNLTWSDSFTQTVSTSPATRSVSPLVTTTYTLTSFSDANGPGNASGSATITINPACAGFYTLAPCRVADTRNPVGPSGGPALAANSTRAFPVSGICGVPADAKAVQIVLTVVNETDFGDLRLFPTGGTAPLASTINFAVNHVRANNAIIPLGTGGQMSVTCDMPPGSTGTTHFLFDVSGYFK